MPKGLPATTGAELDALLASARHQPRSTDVAGGDAKSSAGTFNDKTRSLRHRLRRQLRPHYAATGLLGIAAAVEALHAATGGEYRLLASVAAAATCVCAVTVVGIVPDLRKRLRTTIRPRHRRWLLFSVVTSSVWLTFACYRLSLTMIALLLVAEYVLAARWWRHVRIKGTDVHSIPEPEQASTETWAEKYNSNVGGRGFLLDGSYVFEENQQANDVPVYAVQGVRGKHTIASFLSNLDAISSGTDIPVEDLIVEAHPSRIPSQALIKVVERSPLQGNVLFDGARFHDGIVSIGPYGDLDGEAPYRLYTPGDSGLDGSMWSGFWVGDTGIGKSRGVENISTSIMSAWRTHPTVILYCDPQNGGSSPSLQAHCDYYVPLGGYETMLSGLEAIAHWRGLENSEHGRTGFRPIPCSCDKPEIAVVAGDHRPGCGFRPGIWVVIEECHLPFADAVLAHRTGALARTTRKLGIGFLLLSQYSGVATFGGEEPLRASAMAGNVIVMHTSSRLGGALIPGLEVDPLTLPRHPQGFGYTLRIGSFGRTAPFRNRLIRSPAEHMSRYPRLGLDSLARNAFDHATGGAYSARLSSVEEIRAANAGLVQAMREGRFDDLDMLAGEAAATTTPPKFDVVRFEPWAPTGAPVGDDTGASAKVLEAIATGTARPADLVTATGYSERQVHRALRGLIAAGAVVREGHGRYVLAQRGDDTEELSA